MRRIVNEKTLELNISHELMSILGIQVFGLTQRDESLAGADINLYLPVGNPYLIQFKAAKNGTDGQNAYYRINNNQPNYDQQIILDMAARGGINALYMFPIVVTDLFLMQQFNNLLTYTAIINARDITGNLNWVNQPHRIDVDRTNRTFLVSSEEQLEGSFTDNEYFINRLKESLTYSNVVDRNFSEHVYQVSTKLENEMREYGVKGSREHTFYFFGINQNDDSLGVFQVPLWLDGVSKRS